MRYLRVSEDELVVLHDAASDLVAAAFKVVGREGDGSAAIRFDELRLSVVAHHRSPKLEEGVFSLPPFAGKPQAAELRLFDNARQMACIRFREFEGAKAIVCVAAVASIRIAACSAASVQRIHKEVVVPVSEGVRV